VKITAAQLTRLQTCYAQMCRHAIGFENTRDCRLVWAQGVLGCPVDSFRDLSLDQARTLIDAAQGEIGHRAPLKAGSRRRPGSSQNSRRAGLDGRHDGGEFAKVPELVSAEQIADIQSYAQRLDMGEAQLQAWLKSRSSPLKGRTEIRTTADANKVRWALIGMLKSSRRWVDFGEGCRA
jgi:hypothetical protein